MPLVISMKIIRSGECRADEQTTHRQDGEKSHRDVSSQHRQESQTTVGFFPLRCENAFLTACFIKQLPPNRTAPKCFHLCFALICLQTDGGVFLFVGKILSTSEGQFYISKCFTIFSAIVYLINRSRFMSPSSSLTYIIV